MEYILTLSEAESLENYYHFLCGHTYKQGWVRAIIRSPNPESIDMYKIYVVTTNNNTVMPTNTDLDIFLKENGFQLFELR